MSLQVREILPLLLKSGTTGADAQQVLQQLGQWNGNMASESAEA